MGISLFSKRKVKIMCQQSSLSGNMLRDATMLLRASIAFNKKTNIIQTIDLNATDIEKPLLETRFKLNGRSFLIVWNPHVQQQITVASKNHATDNHDILYSFEWIPSTFDIEVAKEMMETRILRALFKTEIIEFAQLKWTPIYSPWRHGGWYISNLKYPSGSIGCVSNNFPDSRWRIVCDSRRLNLNEPGDYSFNSRDDAAWAEFELIAERNGTLIRERNSALN